MLDEITWTKFLEWIAYAELEPFDEVRGDLRSAQIVACVNNLFREKGKPPYEIKDFVLKFGEKEFKQTQSMETQKRIAYMIAAAFSGAK